MDPFDTRVSTQFKTVFDRWLTHASNGLAAPQQPTNEMDYSSFRPYSHSAEWLQTTDEIVLTVLRSQELRSRLRNEVEGILGVIDGWPPAQGGDQSLLGNGAASSVNHASSPTVTVRGSGAGTQYTPSGDPFIGDQAGEPSSGNSSGNSSRDQSGDHFSGNRSGGHSRNGSGDYSDDEANGQDHRGDYQSHRLFGFHKVGQRRVKGADMPGPWPQAKGTAEPAHEPAAANGEAEKEADNEINKDIADDEINKDIANELKRKRNRSAGHKLKREMVVEIDSSELRSLWEVEEMFGLTLEEAEELPGPERFDEARELALVLGCLRENFISDGRPRPVRSAVEATLAYAVNAEWRLQGVDRRGQPRTQSLYLERSEERFVATGTRPLRGKLPGREVRVRASVDFLDQWNCVPAHPRYPPGHTCNAALLVIVRHDDYVETQDIRLVTAMVAVRQGYRGSWGIVRRSFDHRVMRDFPSEQAEEPDVVYGIAVGAFCWQLYALHRHSRLVFYPPVRGSDPAAIVDMIRGVVASIYDLR